MNNQSCADGGNRGNKLPPSIRIRPATLADVENLIKLEDVCFETDRLGKRSFRHFITSPTSSCVVATHFHGVVASIIILFRINSPRARLYSLAVAPSARGNGIAGKLIQHVEREISRRCLHSLTLEVAETNQVAIHLYSKFGFTPLRTIKNYYENGENAIRMIKPLRPRATPSSRSKETPCPT